MLFGRKKIVAVRWIVVFFLVLLPLFVLPGKLADLKVKVMQQEHRLEESITFRYDGHHQATCYTPVFGEEQDTMDAMGYVFLPSYANLESISVETWVPKVELVLKDQVIEVSNKKGVSCSFQENVPYAVHFYDTSGKKIGSKQITFLKSAGLPTLFVNTETGSMEQLDADKKYKENGYMELVAPDGNTLFSDELRNISGRGNHTFTFEKKSYQIKLTSPADLLEMGKSDTWILLCNVFDISYIRNKLTYDMALQANMQGSPRSEYVDVYFNGVYNGMYLLCEKIEIGENRLEIASLEEKNLLAHGEDLDMAYRFREEDGSMKGVALLRNPEDITGGYLIEHDYAEKYEEGISTFRTREDEEFVLKNPEHASREEVAYISGLMQDIEDAIMSVDGCNPNTGKHFTEYMDLESWADKYLVEEITKNNGGGLTSSYFYKPEDAISCKVFGGPVWDYDKAYGRMPDSSQCTQDLAFLTLHSGRNTHWFSYLYQHEEFREAVKKEYREKFSDYLTIMAEEKVDEYLDKIQAAALLDLVRFEPVYVDYGTMTDYQSWAEEVRQFILERKRFLDKVWLEDASVCQVQFLDEERKEMHRLAVIKGECIEELPVESAGDLEFIGWRIDGSEEFLTTQMPVNEDLITIGVWK